jgi:hypothetical protein
VSRATCNDDVFAYLEDSTGHVLVVKSSKEIERMFLKKKPDPNPRGVPLDDLQRLLSTTTLKISRDAESLIAEHATAVTKLKVIPPAPEEESEDPIQAVVQITTDWPGRFPRLPLLTPESLVFLNRANFSLPKRSFIVSIKGNRETKSCAVLLPIKALDSPSLNRNGLGTCTFRFSCSP